MSVLHNLLLVYTSVLDLRASSLFGGVARSHARTLHERKREWEVTSPPRGFAAHSRVLSLLASLAIIGELARRLLYTFKHSRQVHANTGNLKLFVCIITVLSSYAYVVTGSPSSRYEHRHCCVTFEIQRKYKDFYGKKPIVSVTYENERISIKTAYLI